AGDLKLSQAREAIEAELAGEIEIRKTGDWRHFDNRVRPVIEQVWAAKEAEAWIERLQREDGRRTALGKALLADIAARLDPDPVHDDVDRLLKYLEARKGLFDFAAQFHEDRSLGAGAVEATCKLVIVQRMRRNGARWKRDGARGCWPCAPSPKADLSHTANTPDSTVGDRHGAGSRNSFAPLLRSIR